MTDPQGRNLKMDEEEFEAAMERLRNYRPLSWMTPEQMQRIRDWIKEGQHEGGDLTIELTGREGTG